MNVLLHFPLEIEALVRLEIDGLFEKESALPETFSSDVVGNRQCRKTIFLPASRIYLRQLLRYACVVYCSTEASLERV